MSESYYEGDKSFVFGVAWLIVAVAVLVLGFFLGAYFAPEGRGHEYLTKCMLITPSGPVMTIEFNDKNIRAVEGTIRGDTKVYHPGDHEACLIERVKQ